MDEGCSIEGLKYRQPFVYEGISYHYTGTCYACDNNTFATGVGREELDPRGPIPEQHVSVLLMPEVHGFKGRPVNVCHRCSNDGDTYQAIIVIAKRRQRWHD